LHSFIQKLKFILCIVYFLKRITFLGFTLLTGIILLLALTASSTAIDIHLHDTYLVLGYDFILLHFVFYFLFCAVVYFGLRKKPLSRKYFFIHIIFSILGLLLLCYPIVWSKLYSATLYSDFSNWESFLQFTKIHKTILPGLAIFILGQITFTINIILNSFKKIQE